jgi:transcriptional regulator with XRE-family HTH domain
MRDIAKIGKNLKYLREKAGLSRRRVGHYLGVSVQQIAKYESGVNRLPGDKLYRLQQLFNVPYEYFFEGLDQQGETETKDGRDLLAWEVYLKVTATHDAALRGKIRDVVNVLTA